MLNYAIYLNEYTASAFVFGFILGVMATLYFNKKDITLEKWVSVILIFVWLVMHISGFILGKEISWTFDIIGAGAAGHLIGLDITLLLNKIIKR